MIENSVYLPEVIVNRILVIRGQKVCWEMTFPNCTELNTVF